MCVFDKLVTLKQGQGHQIWYESKSRFNIIQEKARIKVCDESWNTLIISIEYTKKSKIAIEP